MFDVNDYLCTKDAAKELGVSYHTIMARIRKNKLKSIKVGWQHFIHKDDIERAKNERNN